MNNKIKKIYVDYNEKISSDLILKDIYEKKIIQIQNKSQIINLKSSEINYFGPGIILNSSGTKDRPRSCYHQIKNLDQSANSSGIWLKEQGFKLIDLIIFNALPLNHISGFMPLWRSKVWNCEYINISPYLIKKTNDLLRKTILIKEDSQKILITSLVPTQLYRLLSNKYGYKWLKLFDLIWVGGASISNDILKKCMKEKINLAPCYGATETAAMISSLKPKEFLKGNFTSGQILKDIKIRINEKQLIEIKTERLGKEISKSYKIKSFKDKNGWWESGDIGKIFKIKNNEYLQVLGRIDNTINSGGEKVFLDPIKERIELFIIKQNLPIQYFKFEKIKDNIWGTRYRIIIDFKKNIKKTIILSSIEKLNKFSDTFERFEQPSEWIINNFEEKFIYKYQKNWKHIIK